jgi:hypothetical protein
MTLRSPAKLFLRLVFLVLAFAACAWSLAGVLSVIYAGCDQVYGAAFFGVGLLFYVLALEVLERGDQT